MLFPDRADEVHPHLKIDEDLRCAEPVEHGAQVGSRLTLFTEQVEPLLPARDNRLPVDPCERPESSTDPLAFLVGRREDNYIRFGVMSPMNSRLMRLKCRVHAKIGGSAGVHPKKKAAAFNFGTGYGSRDPLEKDRRKPDEHEGHPLATARLTHRVSYMSPDNRADEVPLFPAVVAPDGADVGYGSGRAEFANIVCCHIRATWILACRG